MTDQEINEAVGRKLGWELIASDKPGYAPLWSDPQHGGQRSQWGPEFPIDYCHSIAAAWEIVEYLFLKKIGFIIEECKDRDTNERWFLVTFTTYLSYGQPQFTVKETADNAPMADRPTPAHR